MKQKQLVKAAKAAQIMDIKLHTFYRRVQRGKIIPDAIVDGTRFYDPEKLLAKEKKTSVSQIVNNILDSLPA